jgi:hypothetical protein
MMTATAIVRKNASPMLAAVALILLCIASIAAAAKWNGYSMPRYTAETAHFRIHYHKGIEHLVKPVGDKFEELYLIYQDTYHFKLPRKTEIVLQDGDESNGLTFTNLNFIILWTHDFDFNLRGSHDWFNDVITHEFAHLASIWISLKYPAVIEGLQFGYFTHPNEPRRLDLFHALPSDILPPWFTEGIAQYESSRHGTDAWDSHRDMILRSLALSNKLLTWDHMQVFAGKGDDFEKTYNHGFSLVKYIAEKYGCDKIVAMCRKSAGVARLNFDGVIKDVLGKSGRDLYAEWKADLVKRYTGEAGKIGAPVGGRKLNKFGYENYWPRFSPDGKKVYFLSNGKRDYGFKTLCSYSLIDTIKEDDRIKPEMAVTTFYDIHRPSGHISFSSAKSDKSVLPANRGGIPSMDLFIDTLPPDKEPFRLFAKETERQVTFTKGIFSAAFSPTGDKFAGAQRCFDRFSLVMMDTSGKSFTTLYPNPDSAAQVLHFIYSVAWSPDGKTIAFSYFDNDFRKIALYDTATHAVTQLSNNKCDDRDPTFGPDGKQLYFSSDRTGVFNLYRYTFETKTLSRVSNVLGGAFAPAVSPDGKRVAYAGYDSSGYGIYLIDTLKSVADSAADSLIVTRQLPGNLKPLDTTFATHIPYSKFPHQLLLRPMVLVEQLNTQENNVYSGSSAVKAGVVANLMDAYSWLGMGTELGGMFLLEPHKIYKFINVDDGLINIDCSYDAEIFASTQIFPLTLSADYYLRGIAGKDLYYDEINSQQVQQTYNIRLQNLNLLVSHYLDGQGGSAGAGEDQLALHLLTGYNTYDISSKIPNYGTFIYNAEKDFRAGAMATFMTTARNSRMSISPRGLAFKAQYTVNRLFSTKDDNAFRYSNGYLVENQDLFIFQEAVVHLMGGMRAPWYGNHDLHFDLKGDMVKSMYHDTLFPSFNLPVAWVPGYVYYFRTPKPRWINNKLDTIPLDTVLVTGPMTVSGSLSYRFPLSPPLIDKKFWIFYLEKVFGCLNANFGGGFQHPSDIFKSHRNDWVVSYGAELRLQGSTFGGYPLAVKLAWNRGIDRPAPIGGDRFNVEVGFDFDYWGNILLPDYRAPGVAGRN